MPFLPKDVEKYNKDLSEPKKAQWVAVANSVYDKCIKDGGDDASCAPKAIEQANGVVKTHSEEIQVDGSAGSGNFGHKGIPGSVGGSAPGRGGGVVADGKIIMKEITPKGQENRRTWEINYDKTIIGKIEHRVDYVKAKPTDRIRTKLANIYAIRFDSGALVKIGLQARKDVYGFRSKPTASDVKIELEKGSTPIGYSVENQRDEEMSYETVGANNYTAREETHQGKSHLVIPVIMMIEGVHAGSHGPLLHLSEDLGKFPGSWDGIPISIQHPIEDGMNVSANSPGIIDSQVVGRVYHTQMDGHKLKAEAWIDQEAIKNISPEALAYIQQGKPLDVSVGVFTEDENSAGDYNGKHYEGIARNHRPDHLALLPGGHGACGWTDGCGVRANTHRLPPGYEKGGKEMENDIQVDVKLTPPITFSEEDLKIMASMGLGLEVNEMGFQDITNQIQVKLDAMDSDTKTHYLQECYPDHIVYKACPRNRNDVPMPVGSSDDYQLYSRTYTIADDDSIEFTGEAIPVKKEVTFIPIKGQGGVKVMAEKEVKQCCPEKVELLIQSEQTNFTEADREWLLAMDEDQIGKLTPKEPKKVEAPQVNREQAIQVLKDELSDQTKFLALLPNGDFKASVEHGIHLYRNERATKIATIKAAGPEVYSDDELNAMSMTELDKLASFIKPATNFAPLGSPQLQANVAESEAVYPPGVEE